MQTYTTDDVARIISRVGLARSLRSRIANMEADAATLQLNLEATRAEYERMTVTTDEENIFDVVSLAVEAAGS